MRSRNTLWRGNESESETALGAVFECPVTGSNGATARNIKIAERTQIHSKGVVSRRSPRKMKSTNQTQFIQTNQRNEAAAKPIRTQSWASKPIWGAGRRLARRYRPLGGAHARE